MWRLCSCSTSPEVEVVVRPPQPRQHLVVVQGVVPHNVELDSEHWSVVTLLSLTPVYPPRALLPLADSCSLPGQDPGVHIPRLKPPHGRVSQGLGGGSSEMNRTSAVERSISSQSVCKIRENSPS